MPVCPLDTLATSPINISVLHDRLLPYPDKNDAVLLLHGFQFGFKIPYEGSREGRLSRNHMSALQYPKIVWKKLQDEIAEGRVAGPFPDPPFPNLIVSPIGLVPKSTPGEFRLIFDLSFPKGDSINSHIPPELASTEYTPFDAAIDLVHQEGQGSYLIKVDVKSAFRLLPIHPSDFPLLGMQFQQQYFVDKALPFGLSVSCALFEKFSHFLEWCVKNDAGTNNLIHYLDDFLGCAREHAVATHLLSTTLNTFQSLGVPVASEKVEGPETCLKYLGLTIDTQSMHVRIPKEKISELKSLIGDLVSRRVRKITLRQLQSLIGKLAFACRAVVPGRAFCRRLIDATIGVKCAHHRIRVSASMIADLQVWLSFLDHFNGLSIILDKDWCDNQDLDLYTDAAGSLGFGAYFQGHWAHGSWPSHLLAMEITFKELVPIVLSLHLWGAEFANRRIVFHCDNEAVVHIINKQSTRSKPIMVLVRILVSVCLHYNILFRAKHIASSQNSIADALSRFQWNRFRSLAPQADPSPTLIPDHLWRLVMQRSTV